MSGLAVQSPRASGRLLIYKVLGYLLLLLSLVHLSGAAVSVYFKESSFWTFLGTAASCVIVGYSLTLLGRDAVAMKQRQLFLLTTLSWLIICVFSALPFWLIIPGSSFTNAWFETVSGITTTGSTVYWPGQYAQRYFVLARYPELDRWYRYYRDGAGHFTGAENRWHETI